QRGLGLGVATEQLAIADDALGLCADVDEDLVLVDPDHGPFDDVTVLEGLDLGVLLREQLLHRGRLGTGADRGGGGRRCGLGRSICRWGLCRWGLCRWGLCRWVLCRC